MEDVPVEPSLLYAVKQVELAVRANLDEVLRPHGLTTSTYTALTVLERREGMTTADLARNSFVTPQAMADIITALESRGLISRRPDPDHGRRRLIDLTAPGRAALAEVAPAVAALEERMVAGLDGPARRSLRDSLNSCRAALRG
ncbi:MarR family winged helix-turn-helix transcriptional regulator [Saccharothrix longispora]|uniref:DNA-binding MarR family transcriptional regulator n=1 Tax=Saccharothrix longispora TaxID=33920 RepID=A0ABU1PNY0_9PSEU|nr:MarR family transcriptional regulator [Saccharothrix longispora]MDR6592372.1 DNA-binding MarR family transcriptional regulator [Saccharothrix longispora]